MNILNVLQVVDLVNLDWNLFLLDETEELLGVTDELFSLGNVSKDMGPEQLDAFWRELAVMPDIAPCSARRCWNDRTEWTYVMASGGTVPDAFPNDTTVPFLLTTFKSSSNVSFPTPSKTASTPLPPVISMTFATRSFSCE